MELKEVYELWDRFDNSDAVEIEIGIRGDHLRIRRDDGRGNAASICDNRGTSQVNISNHTSLPADNVQTKTTEMNEMTEMTETTKMNETTKDKKEEASGIVQGTPVNAPLVGTYYQAPSPEEEPFVHIGKMVKKGDVIGIIEAMKLMNEVVAPTDGEVVEILAKDGCMVEYNQPLIVLK